MFGHPAFIARDIGGNAQGKTFFAQQRVAAVSGTEAPDLPGFRKMDNIFFFVARPRNVFLPMFQRRTNRVHTRNNALLSLVDFFEDCGSNTRHDAHVDDHVRRIGKLNSDLRHRAANRTHRKRKDVHGAAAHAAVEESLQLLPHHEWVFPIVGGAGVVFRKRAYKCSIFNAGHVAWISAGVVAAWPQLAVEPGECSSIHKLLTEFFVLGLRPINPMNFFGLSKVRHLLHPTNQMLVGGRIVGGCVNQKMPPVKLRSVYL